MGSSTQFKNGAILAEGKDIAFVACSILELGRSLAVYSWITWAFRAWGFAFQDFFFG